MILFKGFNGKPIFIEEKRIISLAERSGTETTLIVSLGDSSEEWIIQGNVYENIKKYDDQREK